MLCVPCAASALQWDVRDVEHPRMGAIKVAVPRDPVVTSVGKDKIDSLVFFSCEKKARKIAIELANASESDTHGGLPPKEMPKLVCNTQQARSELAATWEVSEIGDALARGLSPSALRQCGSIDVFQNVALPKGWGQASQRIELVLPPNAKELESVFAACGEAKAVASSARESDAAWKPARTTGKGRTNVRAGPDLDSAVVVQLAPNERVLVQSTSTEWWKVKPRKGDAYRGYIRQDRLAF